MNKQEFNNWLAGIERLDNDQIEEVLRRIAQCYADCAEDFNEDRAEHAELTEIKQAIQLAAQAVNRRNFN